MSKKGGFHPFLPVFGGPETIWGKIEKPKKINSYSIRAYFLYTKSWDGIISSSILKIY